ncbi:hypothetical protein SPRG_09190 [Saprolegnia parasitica CBS 223.65]|uniref:BZIP domain-containing protein n=1 Tax=Saprolegnia parasitica (strain CBS 223.65) TaxID=695850 RepID=A0A067C868_SAPPC|nr:hypothetical protein SPRG_09190 [Saprolegnia parasitica CBS 223.65]KDO25365.1 hypothetical protein SPRG_09190 [Saprolegnia parasitica CBS 223.65]|eukprot:XP_012204012.1 hypothetical protein SPRG_09190 [Saprolegnia parasitica CBS 223.65]
MASPASSSSLSEADLVLAKKEHQRLRNRLKQKRHRERHISEREMLQAQILELGQLLTAVSRRGNATAQATLHRLRSEYNATRHVGEAMTAWVASMCTRVLPLAGTPFGWTKTSLLADPAARKLGLDWFSQHLYHNTDRMAAYAQFPSTGAVVDNVLLDVGNGHLDLVGRIQVEYDLSLLETYDALKGPIWSMMQGETGVYFSEFLDTELTSAISPDKMLYRRNVRSERETNYYVCREFSTDDRIVFTFGNFFQDDRLPENVDWRPRMFWYVLERASPTKTRLRVMLYNAPYLKDGKMVSWQDELLEDHGIDCSLLDPDVAFRKCQQLTNDECDPKLHEDYAALQIQNATGLA